MQVVKASDVDGDEDDKSLYMKVSEREFSVLRTLVGYTTSDGAFDAFTLRMYKAMKYHGQLIPGSLAGGLFFIKMNEETWPKYLELQHENH